MTKFESVGVNHLYNAQTQPILNRNFGISCNCCATKGRRADCDCCAIRATFENLSGVFADREIAISKLRG